MLDIVHVRHPIRKIHEIVHAYYYHIIMFHCLFFVGNSFVQHQKTEHILPNAQVTSIKMVHKKKVKWVFGKIKCLMHEELGQKIKSFKCPILSIGPFEKCESTTGQQEL